MALQIKTDQDEILFLSDVNFDPEQNSFNLKFNSHTKEMEYNYLVDYILSPDQSYAAEDYSIYIFYNNDYIENNIYQVYELELKKRIGWVFPIQALISQEHDYSENIHFLRYAFVAFQKLLADQSDCDTKGMTSNKDNKILSLFDFYPQDSFVLIVCNENINAITDFDIKHYYPSLYNQGLYAMAGNYGKPVINCDGQKLYIQSVSEHVKNESFLIHLFQELLINEKHHLVKFYLLYQAVELLIEKIFNKEIIDLVEEITAQSNKLFRLKEELGDLAKEQKRINKLFNSYTRSFRSKEVVMEYSNQLLNIVGRDSKKNASDALYSVRNLLVHDYRSIPIEGHSLISQINEAFEDLVVELLLEISM
ncbi:hypothetical protein KSP24_03560 [Paenibacillus sp. AK121]|uniref:hypothetical protein n=1 Tax=Paenibacillus TaxID=44249 RepID=UPI001C22427F|nr:hypothetical protein [Paenibacillus sp. AK121]MBU9706003.1 hypothetical protein [Paenibacillus sp. AK121]MEE4568136.1 hypothetical protein [Paenibacillus polymyxa]